MKYVSTRGNAPTLNFIDVATTGLASDGGLYVPENWPKFSKKDIASWHTLSYQELAFKIMQPYVDGEIPDEDLHALINKSYSTFRHKDVTPLHRLDDSTYILELFHGPTLAFKDVALQFLGNVLEYILEKQNKQVVIVGATSGDTGSAAIEGCRHCKHVTLFMLHPYRRVSEVQRHQMTTVLADNIYNLAVGYPDYGNFDDCQDMVKAMFREPEFIGDIPLTAVNSINWVRILAQIVYYFYAALKLGAPEKPVSFSVPTGNFGDIFAGYVAKQMGLPIEMLIVATNENDILDRFFKRNDYRKTGVSPTVSPSMDIQISSNFERLLFDLYKNDAKAITALMDQFKTKGALEVTEKVLNRARETFASHATDDAMIKSVIKNTQDDYGYLLDPHTATGVNAAQHTNTSAPVVVLATAHPAKFPDVVKEATGITPELPEHLHDLLEREERMFPLENNLNAVKEFIKEKVQSQ